MKGLFKSNKKIFKLIDDYTPENNQKLIKYIKKTPGSLYELNDNGMSVYSVATLKSFDCLYDVHETYLELKKEAILSNLKENIEILPYEIDTLKTKYTPLHYAVEMNLFDQILYLIHDVKVNINVQNKDGNTSLHIACKFKNINVVSALLDIKNINLNILNNVFQTPLSIAAINRSKKITEMLLKKGAQFKVVKAGKTKKFEFDIYTEMKFKQNEYPEIFKIFEKFKKSRREESKFRNLKREYKYVCHTLKNNVIDESIKILANNLGIKTIKDISKKDLCKKLAERIVIYAQNPDIITDIE